MTQPNRILITILLLGAALRVYGVNWGLPYQYQTEEYRIIKYALKMGGGDLNPHIFEYPSLYLYFMLFLYGIYFAVGRLFGWFASPVDFARLYVSNPTSFHVMGRLAEASFSLGSVFLVYQLGKKMFSEKVGLVAAFCLAILPSAIYTSHNTKGDMAGFFLSLLFWSYCYKISQSGETKDYYIAGAVYGLTLSTKYVPAIMGIALPIAHWMGPNRSQFKHFFGSLLVMPFFFILGTPYAVLSPEFINEFKMLFFSFGSGKPDYWTTLKIQVMINRFLRVTMNLFRMSDWPTSTWTGNYGLGLINFLGLGLLALKKEKIVLLIAGPIFIFWLIVGFITSPAAGYLQPIFPLFILSGSYLVVECATAISLSLRKPNKDFYFFAWSSVAAFFLVSCALTLKWSATMAYAYKLTDRRTVAKEWIDAHIPTGSKILMDHLPYSPPIETSKNQMEKFYAKAVELNHYKKEYFRLKLDVYRNDLPGYEIFVIKRVSSELGVLPKHLEAAQQTQDLIEVGGDSAGWKAVINRGVQYIVVNSWSEKNALDNNPKIAGFYSSIPEHCKLLEEINPPSELHPGPSIRIYEILYSGHKEM